MSIATRTGDKGVTGLMYNRRVSKCHPRVEACGAVDELNSAMGMARALSPHAFVRDALLPIQKDLVTLMGELAVENEDRARYAADGFSAVDHGMVARLDALVAEIESRKISFRGWATPGATADAAALDVARSTARRAERRACALHDAGQLPNPEILLFLNRLSDALWLLARWAESQVPEAAG